MRRTSATGGEDIQVYSPAESKPESSLQHIPDSRAALRYRSIARKCNKNRRILMRLKVETKECFHMSLLQIAWPAKVRQPRA